MLFFMMSSVWENRQFLFHYKQVLIPIMQPEFFTSDTAFTAQNSYFQDLQVIMGILKIKGGCRLKMPLSNLPWTRLEVSLTLKVLNLSKEGNSVTSLGRLPQRSYETSQSSMVPLVPAASSPSPVPSPLHPCRVKTEAAPQAKQPQLSHPVSTGKPSYHLGGPKVILAHNLLLMPSFTPENHEGSHWLGLVNYLFASTHCQPHFPGQVRNISGYVCPFRSELSLLSPRTVI